jgi:hypothetical protein
VLPWRVGSSLPVQFAAGYLAAALVIAISKYFAPADAAEPQ